MTFEQALILLLIGLVAGGGVLKNRIETRRKKRLEREEDGQEKESDDQ